MDIISLQEQLTSLPELQGRASYETEDLRHELDILQHDYDIEEAKETLKLYEIYKEESNKSIMEKKVKSEIKIKLQQKELSIITAKSKWKAKEVESETLNKKLMALCKLSDIAVEEIKLGLHTNLPEQKEEVKNEKVSSSGSNKSQW
jgi:hypothetical protein